MRVSKLFNATVSILIVVALFIGCGSLSKSALNGDVAGVKKRLAKGESADALDRWGWTPVMWAAYYNHYEVLQVLLEQGANPNIRSVKEYGSIAKGSTPLMIASYYGWAGSVRLLLRHGADKNIVNSAGETALGMAEKYNFIEIVGILEKGLSNIKPAEMKNNIEDDPGVQVIYMKDGSKIVGKIISQDRETVTVQTRYAILTLQKEKISEMKYK